MVFIIIISLIQANALDINHKIDSLNRLLPKASDKDKLIIYNALIYYYQNTQLDKAEEFLLKRIDLAKKMNLPEEIAESLSDIAKLYDQKGNREKSMDYYEKAIAICKKNDLKKRLADILRSQGVIYWMTGNNSKATELFLESLHICEAIKDTTGMAYCYMNLSTIYSGADDKKYAIELLFKAKSLAEKTRNNAALAYIYNNIGSIYMDQKKFDEALEYLKKSVTIKEKLFIQKGGIAVTYSNIGEIYFAKKNWQKALEYYRLALAIDSELGNKFYCSYFHLNIANVFRETGNSDSSYKHLVEGMNLALSIPAPAPLKLIYKELADHFKKKGEFSKAYVYLEKYSVIADTLVSAGLKEKLAKYESDRIKSENLLLKKQKEIEQLEGQRHRNQRNFMIVLAALILGVALLIFSLFLLKQRTNRILAIKNTELENANSTKDRFFAIIAHDLKNNLTAFQNVSSSLAENFNRIDEGKKHFLLQRLSSSVNITYHMLENLLSWSVAQLGRMKFNPGELNLLDLSSKITGEFDLHIQKKNLAVTTGISPEIKVFADPDMLTLVIRNLLSNAIKYSPDGGLIEISASPVNGQVSYSVKDHGEGLSEEDCSKLFRYETDPGSIGKPVEKGSGLGLLLSRDFVERNNGRITVETGAGFGCKFTFSLPQHQ